MRAGNDALQGGVARLCLVRQVPAVPEGVRVSQTARGLPLRQIPGGRQRHRYISSVCTSQVCVCGISLCLVVLMAIVFSFPAEYIYEPPQEHSPSGAILLDDPAEEKLVDTIANALGVQKVHSPGPSKTLLMAPRSHRRSRLLHSHSSRWGGSSRCRPTTSETISCLPTKWCAPRSKTPRPSRSMATLASRSLQSRSQVRDPPSSHDATFMRPSRATHAVCAVVVVQPTRRVRFTLSRSR